MQSEPQALSLAPEKARLYIDQDVASSYRSILTFLNVAAVPDLRRAEPLVGYLESHDQVDEWAKVYLAAHWENAVRRVHRLGKIALIDAHLPDPDAIDVASLTE